MAHLHVRTRARVRVRVRGERTSPSEPISNISHTPASLATPQLCCGAFPVPDDRQSSAPHAHVPSTPQSPPPSAAHLAQLVADLFEQRRPVAAVSGRARVGQHLVAAHQQRPVGLSLSLSQVHRNLSGSGRAVAGGRAGREMIANPKKDCIARGRADIIRRQPHRIPSLPATPGSPPARAPASAPFPAPAPAAPGRTCTSRRAVTLRTTSRPMRRQQRDSSASASRARCGSVGGAGA